MSAREDSKTHSIADQLAHSSLAGKYQLLATLGRGGMADVFLAVARGPLGFNKLVVIKRLRDQPDDERQSLEMFLDEARLSARLNHPNIVDTYDVGQEGNSFFIVMEYLDGQPLSRVLKATRYADVHPSAWVYVVVEALRGLHHAHELRDYDGKSLEIVHRDVSPHNIFVTYEAEIKVVDFGIAKATLNVSQTEAGLLKGKIGYMPPEQALAQDVDRRADIFSMGTVLWEALAGRRLLEGGMATIFAKLVHSEVPELLDVKPSVDPKLAEIVRRALKKRPVDRYASAAEMREALLQYLHEVPNPLTKADIARMMGAVFVEQRAAVRAEIEKQLVKAEQGPLEIGNLAESVKVLGYDSSIPSFLPGTLADAGHRRTASAVTAPNARSIAPTASVSPSVSPSAPPRHGRSALRAVALLLAFAAAAAGGAAAVLRFVPHPLSSGPLKASADTMPSSWAPVLETMPTGAEVSWNGTVLGHTPYTLRLPPGPHTIVVSKDGYLSEPVVLGIDASSPFNIVLKPIKTAPSVEPVERSAPPPVAPRFFPRREVTPEIARAPVAEATEAEPEIEVTDRAVEAPAPASPPVERAPAPIEPSPRAPGTMDATAVAATIRAHGDEIQACFDRALMDRTDLHGRLTVQAVVGPTGHVLSASATNTIEGGGRLRVCVLSAVESWTFPAPAGGVNGAVTRTFVFEGH